MSDQGVTEQTLQTASEESNEILLDELPDGYIEIWDRYFQLTFGKEDRTPIVQLPIMAVLILADKSKTKEIKGMRPYAADAAYRAVVQVLDLFKKMEDVMAESMAH